MSLCFVLGFLFFVIAASFGSLYSIRMFYLFGWDVAMPRTNFENLEIYRLSEVLADGIWELASSWPSFEKWTLGTQIVKAADSVGANIAEGTGRGTPTDNRRFARIARGSLNETQHWLRRAYRRGMLPE